MPNSDHAAPVDMEELLVRLRQIGAENTHFEGAVTVPTRFWSESDETEGGIGVFQSRWLAQALHTEAWQPLLLLDARQFVTLAYRRFLGREPDASGMEHVTTQLTRHTPRAEIVAELALSEEALRLQPYRWRRWRWFGRLLRLVLHAPLVGRWGCAQLQWLARGVLRRSERWLTRHAQASDWAMSWAQARAEDVEWRRLQDQLTQQRTAVEDIGLYLQYVESKDEQQHNHDIKHYMMAFEEHFRGSEADLRAQLLHDYVPFLHAARERSGGEGPCLDLGCGRGTWLALLQAEGFIGRGIDSNASPVAHARAQGLDATVGDAFAWLQTQSANSALAVTAFHLVEHLPFALRLALTKEIVRVLRPGGVLIYETPNPENIWVGAHTFYHDPTHFTPVTPASLSFLTKYCGLTTDFYRLHPGPQEELLPGDDAVATRINQLTCSAQDYAIVAWKPVDKATT